MKYNQELPPEVEAKLDAYVERVKNIKWFKPAKNLDKTAIEKQVTFALEGFGVKASVEYRSLKTASDWDAARSAAWSAARSAAWSAARSAAWSAARSAALDAARSAARSAAWSAARSAAWSAAWGAVDILAEDLPEYTKKYPHGNFINLIPLWEAGLYPCGVIDGKFIIYVPEN